MSAHVVGIAGSLNRPSKTRALVDLVAARVVARLAIPAATYDLADLQPALGAAATLDDLAPQPRAIVNALLAAEVLVVGTPVYKAATPAFSSISSTCSTPLRLPESRCC